MGDCAAAASVTREKKAIAMAPILLPLLFSSIAALAAPVTDSFADKLNELSVPVKDSQSDDFPVPETKSASIPTASSTAGYPKTGGHIFDILKKRVHKESSVSDLESIKTDWMHRLNGLHTQQLSAIKGSYELPKPDKLSA